MSNRFEEIPIKKESPINFDDGYLDCQIMILLDSGEFVPTSYTLRGILQIGTKTFLKEMPTFFEKK